MGCFALYMLTDLPAYLPKCFPSLHVFASPGGCSDSWQAIKNGCCSLGRETAAPDLSHIACAIIAMGPQKPLL